jgi:hypothetical protein
VLGGFGTAVGVVLLVLLGGIGRSWGTGRSRAAWAIAGWMVAVVVGGFGLLFVVGAALSSL